MTLITYRYQQLEWEPGGKNWSHDISGCIFHFWNQINDLLNHINAKQAKNWKFQKPDTVSTS